MAEVSGGTASTDDPVGSDGIVGADRADGAGPSDGADGAGPSDGADGARASDEQGAGPAGRRARLLALAGLTVLGSEGDTVGRVRDIYLHDPTGELAAVSVVRRQLSSRHVVIPSAAIAELPAAEPDESSQSIRLQISAETARTGIRPPQTAHLTPELLREAHQVLGLEESATA
ncbi:MAG: PRC-barrel domain-containing protein [Brachybacterium tyrofermentans]